MRAAPEVRRLGLVPYADALVLQKHLVEERRPELLEETDACLGEPHLRRGGELLAHAAHRLRRGAARDAASVGEDHVPRHEESGRPAIAAANLHGRRPGEGREVLKSVL